LNEEKSNFSGEKETKIKIKKYLSKLMQNVPEIHHVLCKNNL